MSKEVVQCPACGWSAIIDSVEFEDRCPNGHKIENTSQVTR